jgi:murein L,D-transpeptidase YcbB/YkuD
MTVSANNELVNQALAAYQDSLAAAASALEKQLKTAIGSSDIAGGMNQFNRVLEDYLKQHQMDLATLAMLSGVSKNTMTRLKKSVESSRVETLSAVLQVMGMELVIARRSQPDE